MIRRKSAAIILTLSVAFLSVALVLTFGMDVSVNDYRVLKQKIATVTGLKDSALHAYFGLIIFGAAAMPLNQPSRTMRPWAIVFGVALLNEGVDLLHGFPHYSGPFIASCLSDVVFTVVFPSSIVFIAKISHVLGSHRSSRAVSNAMRT